MNDMIFETKRLFLRYQREDDVDFLISLWTDVSMTRYTGGPRDERYLREEFKKTAQHPQKEEYDLWIVESKNENTTIGHAGYIPKEIDKEEYIEINYYIDKNYWGNGYATEIAYGLLIHGFFNKKLDCLVAVIDPKNEASKNVAVNIGMQYWKDEERNGTAKNIYRITKSQFSMN